VWEKSWGHQEFKGGGTNKLSDQRPVVLLNSMYQLPNFDS